MNKLLRRTFLFGGLAIAALFALSHFVLSPPFPRPPEIGRGLPNSFEAANIEFQRRIALSYTVPSDLTVLQSQLAAQGFEIRDGDSFAVFSKPGFPCALNWRVFWDSEDGIVTSISGQYGGSCL